MNVALTDDLQRLLRKKVEDGQFPNEEAVVQQALRSFLVEDPAEGSPQKSCATESQKERLPGPFIEDDADRGAFELPRDGQAVTSSTLLKPMRMPDLFPGTTKGATQLLAPGRHEWGLSPSLVLSSFTLLKEPGLHLADLDESDNTGRIDTLSGHG